jgi:GT2 family glycosyltransferase
VAFLGKTGADVVYGDWRHQHHRQDGKVEFENVAASGEQTDVLGALLSDWWVASLALLFRRSIVQKIGGWDESLKAAQDTDFFISVALAGAAIRYLPGCNSVYRRYGAVTVSTGNRMRWLESRCCVFDKASAKLAASGRLNAKYRHGLAQSYFALARLCFDHDRSKYQEIMTKVLALEPGFRPPESRIYNAVQRVFGFSTAELLASWKRRLRHQ